MSIFHFISISKNMSLFFQLRYGFDFHASARNIINEDDCIMADWWSRLQIPLEFQVQNPAECVSLASADGSGRNLYLCMTAPKILFWRCCQKDHVALKRIFSSCSCNVLTMLSGTSRKAVNRVFVLSLKKTSHWRKKGPSCILIIFLYICQLLFD